MNKQQANDMLRGIEKMLHELSDFYLFESGEMTAIMLSAFCDMSKALARLKQAAINRP